jgi:cysteine desulfurase
MEPIYLDWNSTAPLSPAAWEAMRPYVTEAFGNPASAHSAGRKARQGLEDAREKVAALLGAEPDEVIFTSGATEANNLAIFGLTGSPAPPAPLPSGERGAIVASPIEHPCVIEPVKQLEARGWAIDWLPVTARGVVDADAAVGLIRPETRLLSLMLVNHETGAIQPVAELANRIPSGVLVHTDAAQAVGKMPVRFRDLGVTALTVSGHKFGGPKGVGVLVLERGTPLRPLLFGGHQQQARRPGTEPVALAAGLAAALEHSVRHMDENRAKLEALRERLWERLRAVADPVVLNGPKPGATDVLPTTLNVSFPGCRGDLLLIALDLVGIACSTGSACSSGSLLPSPVLKAMGVADEVLTSAIRFSFGPDLSLPTIEEASRRIGEAVRRIRSSSLPEG